MVCEIGNRLEPENKFILASFKILAHHNEYLLSNRLNLTISRNIEHSIKESERWHSTWQPGLKVEVKTGRSRNQDCNSNSSHFHGIKVYLTICHGKCPVALLARYLFQALFATDGQVPFRPRPHPHTPFLRQDTTCRSREAIIKIQLEHFW